MRNLRKLTAAVLAVALVLTSITAVFAADSATLANADKAVTLKDLGLYSGQDANDPKVGLENALTTQDSLIFLAKLFGYYDASTKLSSAQVAESLAKFDDAASISDYAKSVVAYSAANGILSGSTKDGKFFVGAKDTVTAARFATFMLKQMGYSVEDYKASVAQLAETKGSKVAATISGDLTRDAAIGIMYGALAAEKATGKPVITDIVGDNADLKAKTEKLGLIAANADKAVTLKDLGLYSGQDANDPKVGLENALTTQDSLIFLAKLFGYYDASTKLSSAQVAESLAKFDDAASISDYAKSVIAYSAANGILSGSTKDGKFFVGAKDTVTAARFATFMLKQMGYTVEDYKVSVAKLAETKGSKVAATITGDLTRDAAIGIMYGALTAEKASGKTVIADIVGDNADLKAKAEKAGLVKSVSSGSGSKELRVVSVKALNTKQVEIKFNLPMDKDSAQDETNYEIKNMYAETEETLTDNSCKLGDDMMTVTITLDSIVEDCLTNSSIAKVIVSKDIMAANTNKLGADIEVVVEVMDGMIPTVKEVKATGEKNIRITFSEPVYETNNNTKLLNNENFAVKSGTYTYYVQKAELNLDVINIEVGTNLIEGPVTVTVNAAGLDGNNAIQDYAGYKVFKGDTTFNYVKDTSVSIVIVKSAIENKVVLNFSKPVKGTNIKLYHTAKNVEAYKAEATETDYVDEITFTFDGLPSGTLTLFLVNSENGALIDRYGIRVPDQSLTCHVEDDTAAPVVTGCEVIENDSINIIFNEELDEGVAYNSENYVVKKLSDNKEIPFSVDMDASMKSVELTFSAELEENTEYQLLIKKYQDIYGNINASEYTYSFTTADNKHPVVIDDPEVDQHCCAVAENGKIYIVYSEAMNEDQMLDKGNYQVSIDQGVTYMGLGDDDTITKVNDRIVRIYFKELEAKNDPAITPFVKIAPIMDLAGKRLNGRVDAYTVENIGPENVYIEEAQLIAKDRIKVVFSKKMGSISWSDMELTNLTTPGSISVIDCESTTINSDGKTEVVLILNEELAADVTDAEGARIGITTIDAPSSESEWGSKLRPQFSIDLDDKTAPEIVKWNHDNDVSTDDIALVMGGGDLSSPQVYSNDYTVPQDTTGTITIFFSEDIKESTLTVNTFTVTGFTITNIIAPAETKTVILTVKADADNTPVKTTVTQVSEIYDTADNAFVPSSTWAVTLEDNPLTS